MKFYILLFALLINCYAVVAQPFVPLTSGLPAIGRSAMAFADFDNDNDLDLVMTGLNSEANPLGKVFLNQQGNFVEIESGISGLYNSALAVADYDLDGNMDIVMTGRNANGNATFLYRNTGSASFELIDAGFYNAGSDGDLAWGDYNNDGYPDLVISGGWDTKLYHNNGDGSFTEINSGLTIMNSPSLSWGDCDNDGDIDLLMVGDAGSVAETFIYLNDQGTFSRLEADIEGAVGGSARWGDYDNDGNLDILITGKDISLVPVSYVYRNNGNKTFSFANAGLVGTALGPSDWIDYDNDGDLDIMLAGENAGCGNASTLLYNNDGVGGFNQVQAGLPFIERASSVWGDYDNDGDVDLLLSGLAGNPATFFFRNDLLTGPFQQNTPPSVPGDLYTYVSGDYAVISWARSTDQQTPQMAVSYNVMVGTEPGSIDVVSPQSDIATGLRYSVGPGNTGNNDFMVFRSMAPGDYYFKIQAIDQAFAGSEFSEEGTFTVLSTGVNMTEAPDARIFTIGSLLKVIGVGGENAELTIASVAGGIIWTGRITGSEFNLPLDNYPAGLYLVRLIKDGKQQNAKFVR
jgi:hypothetical protein